MKAIRWLAAKLGLDDNTLRRRSDKIAAYGTVGLLATFLVGAPVATLAMEHWSYRVTMAQQHDQESWHQVPALLLRGVSGQAGDYYSDGSWTWAQWKTPDGRTKTGEVQAPAGAKAGSHTPVWIDSSGHYTGGPPLSRDVALLRVVAETTSAPFVLAMTLLLLWGLGGTVLDRRRLADWEADWNETGPKWTQQFRTHGL